MAGIILIMILAVISIFAGYIASYEPNRINLEYEGVPQPPSLKHIFGTDNFGRDCFSRVLYATRVSLSIGLISVIIFIFIGTTLGLISGYYGEATDNIIMRMVDFMLSVPVVFLILIIQVIVKPSIFSVILVIGFTGWAPTARLIRAEIFSLKERSFIKASSASGAGDLWIITRHLLPNVVSILIVTATLGIANTILLESVISYLGFGVQAPDSSWGNMLQGSQEYIINAPWMSIFPGLMIMITVLAFNFTGEGLRDALDPRQKINN